VPGSGSVWRLCNCDTCHYRQLTPRDGHLTLPDVTLPDDQSEVLDGEPVLTMDVVAGLPPGLGGFASCVARRIHTTGSTTSASGRRSN
jgi:hypothetical protein